MFDPNLDTLKVYEAGKPIELVVREFGVDPKDIIKLASNENPNGCSPKVRSLVKENVDKMTLYPDDSMFELKKGLAKKYNVASEEIIIGAGSDQVLEFCVHAVAPRKILTSKTTFAMYAIYAAHYGAKVIKTPSDEHVLDEFREALKEKPEIIFLCLPNNPLGECLDTDEVFSFIDEVDSDTLIILDGAYQEYAALKDPKKYIDPKKVLSYPNVIYTGTFSKAYGLGGMRVGYAIANKTIIQNLYKLRPPFNITVLSLLAGIEALKDESFVETSVKECFEEMTRYEKFCYTHALRYIESYTNFITIYLDNASEVADTLLKKGIIVRNLASYGLNAIRITIGTHEQNSRLLETLETLL